MPGRDTSNTPGASQDDSGFLGPDGSFFGPQSSVLRPPGLDETARSMEPVGVDAVTATIATVLERSPPSTRGASAIIGVLVASREENGLLLGSLAKYSNETHQELRLAASELLRTARRYENHNPLSPYEHRDRAAEFEAAADRLLILSRLANKF